MSEPSRLEEADWFPHMWLGAPKLTTIHWLSCSGSFEMHVSQFSSIRRRVLMLPLVEADSNFFRCSIMLRSRLRGVLMERPPVQGTGGPLATSSPPHAQLIGEAGECKEKSSILLPTLKVIAAKFWSSFWAFAFFRHSMSTHTARITS